MKEKEVLEKLDFYKNTFIEYKKIISILENQVKQLQLEKDEIKNSNETQESIVNDLEMKENKLREQYEELIEANKNLKNENDQLKKTQKEFTKVSKEQTNLLERLQNKEVKFDDTIEAYKKILLQKEELEKQQQENLKTIENLKQDKESLQKILEEVSKTNKEENMGNKQEERNALERSKRNVRLSASVTSPYEDVYGTPEIKTFKEDEEISHNYVFGRTTEATAQKLKTFIIEAFKLQETSTLSVTNIYDIALSKKAIDIFIDRLKNFPLDELPIIYEENGYFFFNFSKQELLERLFEIRKDN